jgi:Rha family phage regulatory protein
MDELTKRRVKTINSREVAEMMEMSHKNLLRKIDNINSTFTERKIELSKYWIENEYTDKSGKTNRCFEILKRGCEFLAHKTTGEKGNLFTDRYMDYFENIRKKSLDILTTIENTTFQGNIDNLVISKDGIPITTSKVIAEVTGKEHFHILRDIREEISKLKEIHNPNLDSEIIINDFKETTYLAENGQIYTQYELGEMATMQLMLKYSTEYRAKFILAFQKMKIAIMNMFKAKVLDEVLPQNNKLRQYIYVIKNPLNETVKIGVAQDVDKRIKQLQTGAGIELELIYKSMICSNAFAIEKDVHKYFEEYRTFGEWFKINPEIVINFLEKQDFILKSEYMKYLQYDLNDMCNKIYKLND